MPDLLINFDACTLCVVRPDHHRVSAEELDRPGQNKLGVLIKTVLRWSNHVSSAGRSLIEDAKFVGAATLATCLDGKVGTVDAPADARSTGLTTCERVAGQHGRSNYDENPC